MIERRFSRALSVYDRAATAQNMIIDEFVKMINVRRHYPVVLEIGCGSGNLSRLLSGLDYGRLYLNDICSGVVDVASAKLSGRADFIIGDAEKLDFRSAIGIADLVVSTSVVQWFSDFSGFAEKMHGLLADGGEFIFSSFLPGNFMEIHDVTGKGLDYFTVNELKNILAECGFDVAEANEGEIRLEFRSPVDVLRHIKDTGVNAISGEKWTRGMLSDFTEKYMERYSDSRKLVPLTYRPVYVKAVKPVRKTTMPRNIC